MRSETKLLLWILFCAFAVLFVSCGLINSWLGSNGVPTANTPEAQQAAHNADFGIWQWLGQLFGVAPVTPQGPPQLAQTGVVLTIGTQGKRIVKGTHRVAKAVAAGAVHAVKAVKDATKAA